MDAFPREVRLYETAAGRAPFAAWMDRLEGRDIYEIVMLRLDRVERGTSGETRSVGDGVSELIIDHGPGYRIYYGQLGRRGEIVVLLHGGDKKTQPADIRLAKKYWKDFNHAQSD